MADSETANYDISVIDMSPAGLNVTSRSLVELSKSVAEHISTINTTLYGLRVAWQGQAASDAEEVQNEWTRVMTELFGTEEDPSRGVLPALADGVGMAWGNFSVAEQGVTKIFTEFLSNLTATGGGDPEEVTDTNRTAVTMTFPY